MQETRVWSLGWEDPLQKEMATHSSILAWRIPWMEEPGGLQSMGSQWVRHNWVTSLSLWDIKFIRKKKLAKLKILPALKHTNNTVIAVMFCSSFFFSCAFIHLSVGTYIKRLYFLKHSFWTHSMSCTMTCFLSIKLCWFFQNAHRSIPFKCYTVLHLWIQVVANSNSCANSK